LVSDEPVTTQNIKIRVVHASSDLSTVSVMLDGKTLFDEVSFGNVTEYSLTVRGIHNISIMESSGSASSIKIFTFLAWEKSYTIAIVKTSSGIESQEVVFPGFMGPTHKIFVDEFAKSAKIGENFAYIQVVHLAMDIGAIDVTVGKQNITDIQFLESSLYSNVEASAANIEVMLAGSTSPLFTLRSRLRAGTLYTLWALQETSGDAKIFLTTDRRVQVVCTVMDIEGGSQEGQQGEQGQGSEQGQEGGQQGDE